MKRLTKLIAIFLCMALLASTLAACTAKDKTVIIGTLDKSSKINSAEIQTDMTMKVSVKGMPKQDQAYADMLLSSFGNINLKMNQKLIQNKERTFVNTQTDMAIQAGEIKDSVSLWASYDLTKKTPTVKEIIKLPAVASDMVPELEGIQYLVLDQNDLFNNSELTPQEYKKALQSMSSIQTAMTNFVKQYLASYKGTLKIMTYKGQKTVKGQKLSWYQVKLDNTTLNALTKYMLTDTANNKATQELFKKLLISVAITSGNAADVKQLEADLNDAFKSMTLSKEEIAKLDAAMKNLKLLGSKGVVCDFMINKEGYIVSQSGTMDFLLDTKSLEKFAAQLDPESVEIGSMEYYPTIGLTFEYTSNMTNINKTVKITQPQLTSKNSIKMSDLEAVTEALDGYGDY